MREIIDEIHLNLSNLQRNLEDGRVFHGRGHLFKGLSHVSIDYFSNVFYIRIFEEDQELENILANILINEFNKAVILHRRYSNEFEYFNISKEDALALVCVEKDLKFELRVGKNQNPGFFWDMKEGRKWILENSKEKKVLNLFAYTCSISVMAKKAQALEVRNVDVSSSFLSWGRKNHEINGQTCQNIYFDKKDVLKSLGWLSKKGPYDIVFLDPPSFQKKAFDYQKDYEKIIKRIDELVLDNGYVVSVLNTPFETSDFLKKLYAKHCPHFELVETLYSPLEFREADKEKGVKICIFRKRNRNV